MRKTGGFATEQNVIKLLLQSILFMQRLIIFILFLSSVPNSQLSAQQAPCSTEAHAQFDFWLGDWTVYHPDEDTIVGNNIIQKILNGCVVMENWTGATGFEGKSFNTYNTRDSAWNQVWVDVSGATYHFKGKRKEGGMKMKGQTSGRDGTTILFEMDYKPDPNSGDVRQTWRQSTDNGQNWTAIFDGIYKRKK